MAELIPADSFFPHAMSTTFVGREIMDRLHDKFPEFNYKRAALSPHLRKTTEGVDEIIWRMEQASEILRRNEAERISP